MHPISTAVIFLFQTKQNIPHVLLSVILVRFQARMCRHIPSKLPNVKFHVYIGPPILELLRNVSQTICIFHIHVAHNSSSIDVATARVILIKHI